MAEVSDANSLRAYVYEMLCQHERLEIGHFRMTERTLKRGDRAWGILYRLVGPRQVQATAVWVIENRKLMFYGSSGRKFGQAEVPLSVNFNQVGE